MSAPRPMPLLALVALLALNLPCPALAAGGEPDYVFDLPAQRMIGYEIELEIVEAGPLAIEASWDSPRVLVLKLTGPDGTTHLRRSGPPPLTLELDVASELLHAPGLWKLSIRGLPAERAAQGRIRLELPGSAPPVPAAVPPPAEATAAAAPLPSWLVPRTPPDGAAEDLTQLYRSTENLRAHVAAARGSSRDRYGWQEPLLSYLASQRDGVAELPDSTTSEVLARTVEAMRGLERLALAKDPLIAGPPPPSSPRRNAWLLLRAERIRPVEAALDRLLQDVGLGGAQEAAAPEWLPRLVSSLMACERHFEQRGRLGDEAVHADIVAEQWDGLRLAADALDSLVRIAIAADAAAPAAAP